MSLIRKFPEISFALLNTLLLVFIYGWRGVRLKQDILIIPWDGYIYESNVNPVDKNNLNINSIGSIIDFPEQLINFLFQDVFLIKNPFIVKIIFLWAACFILSIVIYNLYRPRRAFDIAFNAICVLLVFSNIPFQWLINNGVMYRFSMQILYLFAALVIIYAINFDKKNNSRGGLLALLITTNIYFVLALWSFSYIVASGLIILLISMPILFNNRHELFKFTGYKEFIILNSFLALLLVYFFYQVVVFDHFSVVDSTYEASNAHLSGSTYSHILGGVLYQIQGLSDWSMYTDIGFKNFGTMDFNFKSNAPQLLTIGMYVCVIFFLFSKSASFKSSSLNFAFLFLLIAVFFAKGAQTPFGYVFELLVNKFKVFQSIRTPDNKFGVFIFLVLILILMKLYSIQKSFFLKCVSFVLCFIYLIVAVRPILDGDTLFGRRDSNAQNFSYLIGLDRDQALLDQIKKFDSVGYSGVLIPGYGYVATPSGYTGFQDYPDRVSSHLLNYAKATSGPYGELLREDSYKKKNLSNFIRWLDLRGIRYIVLRKSTLNNSYNFCIDCIEHDARFNKIYDDQFTVLYGYKPADNANLVNLDSVNYALKKIKFNKIMIILLSGLMFLSCLILIPTFMRKSALK